MPGWHAGAIRPRDRKVSAVDGSVCEQCGARNARISLEGAAMCDDCFNLHMGLPVLPHAAPPLELTGPDSRHHRFEWRIWRAPTGIAVELEEVTNPKLQGYRFAVLGAHDEDPEDLFSEVQRIALDGVANLCLEPHPFRKGWTARGDAVEGRLVWSDDHDNGDPYDVVVDGRLLTWEELGRALASFEGWRFRIEIEDRYHHIHDGVHRLVEELQSEMVDISIDQASEVDSVTDAQLPVIADVLTDFLSEQEERLAPRTYRNYAEVVELLTHCLNNYGYQSLSEHERRRFENTYESDPDAFVHLFGPEKIAENLGEFLGYFMIRKVAAGEDLLRSSGTVTKKLVKWLAHHGYLNDDDVETGTERATGASRDLPRAEKLSRLLSEQSRRSNLDARELNDDDYVEDYLTIERVEAGALWFGDGVGSVKVTTAISDLAEAGWSVSLVLGRSGEQKPWQILEVGNVYP
jgi:hypothetical protein